jgi:phosphonate transport system substrate-binding protein
MSLLQRRRAALRLALAGLVLAWLPAGAGAVEEVAYVLALIPGAPPVTLSKRWTPVIEHVSKETGIRLRLQLFDRMAEFEREIWKGPPDFIFASPIQTVVAREFAGFIPLVRDRRPVEIGLFVRQDSPIRGIDDLRGKKIAFVGNKNICSVFMQHELTSYGRKLDFDREYAGSTKNVLVNVILGKVDAGAVFGPELEREPADTRAQLREIVKTPQIAPHPLSAHPRVPAEVREAVKRSLLRLAATPAGAELLKPMRLDELVEADYDRDYRRLEEIDIKKMTNWGE